MNKDLLFYSKKFAKLRVDRVRGIAPHKPILILSAIALIQQEVITQNRIFLSPELIATFLKYWSHLGSESHRSDIAQPFFHLQGDGFWHLKAKVEFEPVINSKVKIKTLSGLRDAVQYAYFDDELFELIQDPSSRSSLIDVLANTWFSDKTSQIAQLFQINSFQEFQDRLREQGGIVYSADEIEDESKLIVRDAAFRKIVVSAYEFRCAFCELQILNSLNQHIVDGAHIKPFSQFRDDRFDNGLSLCKNHHWAFDRGWFTVDDDYKIIVSEDLREESPHARTMRDFHGQHIALPAQQSYFPRIDALRWHRENVFNHGEQLFLT
ncbi:HNH endonuclease [Tumidithrix elongata RA019]|uniref:HNH endonuclease n=1 Tax=Tumidithrix elongata BACA0141 TaxID=2716417 RepID=A0AAW9Q2W1_9CYAN|nr:HNH endonuclease [Tumidithrix elongata RA019]